VPVRVHHAWYPLRAWVYLVHPFLAGTPGLALCLRIRAISPAAAPVGAAGFSIRALTEAAAMRVRS